MEGKQQRQDEEQLNESIKRKEELECKIILAKIVNQKLTENLESTRIEREKEFADTEMLQQHVGDVMKADMYAAWHVNKTKLELKRRSALNDEMLKMVRMLHQNPLEHDIDKAEKAFGNFYSDIANAPWLPEKRKIQEEFKNYSDELVKVREEVVEYDEAIAKIKTEAELHAKMPFITFCLMLANYDSKSTKIRQLMKIEVEKAGKLKEKLLMVSDEELHDSGGELDATQLGAPTEEQQNVVEDGETQLGAPTEQQQNVVEDGDQQRMEDNENEENVFDSAPHVDVDSQPLFDFFSGGDGVVDQNVIDGSFNFGSFNKDATGGPVFDFF